MQSLGGAKTLVIRIGDWHWAIAGAYTAGSATIGIHIARFATDLCSKITRIALYG
jgi:hypothetical protein